MKSILTALGAAACASGGSIMRSRPALALGAALGCMAFLQSATANVIDFNLPNVQYLGNTYSQDGFTFTNSSPSDQAYGHWLGLGATAFNADGSTADIFANIGFTTNTITNDAGTPFSFTSIGLADVYNNHNGHTNISGSITFAFNHTDGTTDTATVSLVAG